MFNHEGDIMRQRSHLLSLLSPSNLTWELPCTQGKHRRTPAAEDRPPIVSRRLTMVVKCRVRSRQG